MKIQGKAYRSLWEDERDPGRVHIIDQRWLPHNFRIETLYGSDDFAGAIRDMHVRGAPLIGATAAYGLVAACREARAARDARTYLQTAVESLMRTRPTAVDLAHALQRVQAALPQEAAVAQWEQLARDEARSLVEESLAQCRAIGQHGLSVLEALARRKQGAPLNVLTHCNAGWLACLDYGTATAPLYLAHDRGLPVHVWVDETRPRNQGARLTAFELLEHGLPHTVIADNTGGYLMQTGQVDLVIVGTDRTTRRGDVANKVGTYLKALAARDNNIPFYVALPGNTIDWELEDGLRDIPIEERDAREVTHIWGLEDDRAREVRLTPAGSPAKNYGFDLTPARLVTGLITERGTCEASEAGLLALYPERRRALTE